MLTDRSFAIGVMALFAGALGAQDAPQAPWHEPPFRVEAEGTPIAVPTGHAAPAFLDTDGDGVRDLVVGSYGSDAQGVGGGTCRIYRNTGSNRAPAFGAFVLLQSDGKPAAMESS